MKRIIIVILTLTLIFLWYLFYELAINIEITSFEAPKKIYLIVGEVVEVPVTVTEKSNKTIKLKYNIENEEIISGTDNKIKGLTDGKTKLVIKTQNNKSKEVEIIVTSLITKPTLNNDKEYIKCGEYTKEESDLLEELLNLRIEEAGYETRGGVLAAARFLILEFKSGIRYFNENGRLENHSNILHIDGEGRFYHKGLYLTEDKYEQITASTEDGPKMWGCNLHNLYFNKDMENGLDCSGFITWALLNGGYDIKDVGAGEYDYVPNELLDLEPKEKITKDLLYSGKIKAGDLIGFDGHIAMIIGIESNKVYVGESYETGLRVRTFSYSELVESEFTDIILMDNYYKNEGKYHNMW